MYGRGRRQPSVSSLLDMKLQMIPMYVQCNKNERDGHDRCVVDLSDESMISRWVSVSGWQRKGHVPLSARLRGNAPA